MNGRIGHGTQERVQRGGSGKEAQFRFEELGVTVSHPRRDIQEVVERWDWNFCPMGDPEL